MTGLMVQPPVPGDQSFAVYESERSAICESLQRRAAKVSASFDALPGVSCPMSDGALYAFPRLKLPPSFLAVAKEKGMVAAELYCLKLLEATGVAVIPGSGFGQREGTFHLRTTFLPPEYKLDEVLERISSFHTNLMQHHEAKRTGLSADDGGMLAA
jgi:aspartate/methionine/tyrosine aminotransferase